ncbi:hypothetical protein LNP74_15720 [Klebsiella pneumoniae subsp. pneumoniae]|nr:hypothetical protein [Klebsiella pneumoniae subsp. pneumoniae]
MNKIDMLDDFEPRIDRDDENKPIRVWLSAQTGGWRTTAFQALTERLSGEVAPAYAALTAERRATREAVSISFRR